MSNKHDLKFVFGSNGNDDIVGLDWNQFFFAADGNDKVDARGGNDHIFGGKGNDALLGGVGNDHLFGNKGNDLLDGGSGNDTLNGGDGVDTFRFKSAGFGKDKIADFTHKDILDLNGLGFASAADAKAAMKQVGDDVVLKIGSDQLVLENVHLADIATAQIIVGNESKGSSSSQTPYLVSSSANIEITSVLTVGDAAGNGYKMAGIPDGIGAYDNGDGTFTVLMNHEIGNTLGAIHAHGAKGSFVSEWVIDKTTLAVQSGADLIQHAWMYNTTTHAYEDHSAALGNGIAFNRFCSADLADQSAFYNAATGLGYNGGRLYLNGEESGAEGRAMAHIATGAEKGNSYELAWLGNMSYENLLANPYSGDKTVVAVTDDTSPLGQVYFYSGTKQATGNAIEKAGLAGGHLLGIHVTDFEGSSNNAPNSTSPLGADNSSTFTMVDLGDVSGLTGAHIQTASEANGVTEFLRPEDGAWDTIDHDRFYFVTTNGFNQPSQLWAADFSDSGNPAAGGTLRLLLDGSELGHQMFDNITVNDQGKVILQEDPGNQGYLARVWEYDPTSDSLSQIAQHDPSRFVTGGSNFLTQDEESSGVVDISDILGNAGENVYLLDVQAHYPQPGDLVEGGQLLLMREFLV